MSHAHRLKRGSFRFAAVILERVLEGVAKHFDPRGSKKTLEGGRGEFRRGEEVGEDARDVGQKMGEKCRGR